MLKVVQNQQRLPVSQSNLEMQEQGFFVGLGDGQAQHLGNCHEHPCWLLNGCQGYKEHPIGKAVQHRPPDMPGQMALAHPAGTDQRQ